MKKDNDNRKIAIYSRKSKYTGKGESVENQVEMCKKKIIYEYNDIDIERDIIIYEDEGFTGYNLKRPAFQRLLKDIKNNNIKTLVFYRLDRVSRNVNDFSNLLTEFEKYNINFFSVTENYDNSTPSGKAMLMVVSVFAQLERDTIAERIRDNMIELAKTGRWLGGNPPTGYRSEAVEKKTIDGKIKKLYKLTFVDDEINIVKLIYKKFLEYKSLTKVETYLLQNDIKTKKKKDFQRWGIKNILLNPVYAMADKDILDYFKENEGELFCTDEEFDGKNAIMAYNKTEKKPSTLTITRKDMKDWIIAIGKHEGIISGKEWVEVQNLLRNNADKKYRMPIKNNSILSGIIKCRKCGSSMIPKMTQIRLEDGTYKFNYICDLKYKSKGVKCDCKNSNGNEVDLLVLEKIKEIVDSNSSFYKEMKKLSISLETNTNSRTIQLEQLKNSYRRNQTSIEKLIENLKYVDPSLVNEISNQVVELKKKNAELENQMQQINKAIPEAITDSKTASIILRIMDTYFHSFHNLDLLRKRDLIRLFISSVETDGNKLYINLIGTRNQKLDTSILLGDSSK